MWQSKAVTEIYGIGRTVISTAKTSPWYQRSMASTTGFRHDSQSTVLKFKNDRAILWAKHMPGLVKRESDTIKLGVKRDIDFRKSGRVQKTTVTFDHSGCLTLMGKQKWIDILDLNLAMSDDFEYGFVPFSVKASPFYVTNTTRMIFFLFFVPNCWTGYIAWLS